MIREFWQDRKEEKKRLKELKKQNKKLPITKEQRAYKIFGIVFTLFLIFGVAFNICGSIKGTEDFSWDSLIGITDDMKVQLEQSVEKKDLLFDKQIDVVDWSYCKDLLIDAGVGDVIIDNKIDMLHLVEGTTSLASVIILDSRMLGALSQKMIESSLYGSDFELIEVSLQTIEGKLVLNSLFRVNLSAVVLGGELPSVFVTTTSTVEILNNKMYSLNSNCKINKLEESENIQLIETINKSSLSRLEFYTNELISRQINEFASSIGAKVRINNSNVELY